MSYQAEWQAYVNDELLGSTAVSHGAIVGRAEVYWQALPTFICQMQKVRH